MAPEYNDDLTPLEIITSFVPQSHPQRHFIMPLGRHWKRLIGQDGTQLGIRKRTLDWILSLVRISMIVVGGLCVCDCARFELDLRISSRRRNSSGELGSSVGSPGGGLTWLIEEEVASSSALSRCLVGSKADIVVLGNVVDGRTSNSTGSL